MTPREAFSTFDELSERRENKNRATKSDNKYFRKKAKSQDDLYQGAYEAGLDEAKRQQRDKQKAQQASKARGFGRKVRREAARPVRTGSTKALRDVQGTASDQIYSGLYILGLSLLLVLLYDLLKNASYVGGFLGGISKGIKWLEDPAKSIGYSGS